MTFKCGDRVIITHGRHKGAVRLFDYLVFQKFADFGAAAPSLHAIPESDEVFTVRWVQVRLAEPPD